MADLNNTWHDIATGGLFRHRKATPPPPGPPTGPTGGARRLHAKVKKTPVVVPTGAIPTGPALKTKKHHAHDKLAKGVGTVAGVAADATRVVANRTATLAGGLADGLVDGARQGANFTLEAQDTVTAFFTDVSPRCAFFPAAR